MPERRNINLALEVTKAAFKALFPSVSTRYEGIADLAKFAFGNERWKQQNSLRRQLEEGVDILTERLAILEANEFRWLDSAERDIATDVLVEAISRSNITKRDLEVDMMLNRDEIVRRLEPECINRWNSALLSEEAIEYGHLFLREASQYMINLVRNLPEFNNDITWENYILTRQFLHTFESSISNVVMPRYRPGLSREMMHFEASYATDIVSTFGTMELIGIVDLPIELRRQPLDVAYITLAASSESLSPSSEQGDKPSGPTVSRKFDALLAKILNVAEIWEDTKLTTERKLEYLIAAVNKPSPEQYADRRHHVSDAPIRILITGDAGSGKTTAVRWLAVQIARRELSGSLAALNDHVPFIIPLRHVFRGQKIYPTESDLINAVSSHRETEMPGNWINEKLRSGNAVVIFDGLDELFDRRADALRWIHKLISDYPRSHFIVTSRPHDLDTEWFIKRAFINVAIQPMEPVQIQECVSAWFAALRHASPQNRWDDQGRSERLLAHDIDTRRPVQDLAKTPLLCAMLCAFYAHNISDSAPRSRSDLYKSVINVLVETRERERRVAWNGPRFDLTEKLEVLQAIARYLTESQKTVISLKPGPNRTATDLEKTALEVIEERLSGMPTATITASEALRFLTERSVVFQKTALNEAQFAHKTFQEYLAACDFALYGGLNELIAHVGNSAWRDILVFAASVGKTDIASDLVDRILRLGQIEDHDARERLLLAAECLTAASHVYPAVAEKASRAITLILPPRTDDEATLVAGFGEGILPWLTPGRIDVEDAERSKYSVRAAALVGGPAALEVISDYSRDPSAVGLEPTLVEVWDRFDPEQYAQLVLANLPLLSAVRITSGKLVKAVGLLPHLKKLQVQARHGLMDLQQFSSLKELEELNLGGMTSIRSLNGVESMLLLKKLGLMGATSLEGINELTRLQSLEELYLQDCGQLLDISELGKCRNLRVLYLTNCIGLRDFGWARDLKKLRTLNVSGCYASDLSFCAELSMLRTLKARVAVKVDGMVDLSRAVHLRHLTMKCGEHLSLRLPSSGHIRTVVLSGYVTGKELDAVGECDSISELIIEDGGNLVRLDALRRLQSLERLVIRDAPRLEHADAIGGLVALRSLELPGSSIDNLEFARGLERLEYLNLDHCRNLSSVSALGGLHSLQFVSLLEGVPHVGEDELSRAAEEANFRYEHDIYDPLGYETG